MLRDLRTAVQRGRNVAMLAAAGSGHELVFAAAVDSSCQAGRGVQALVLAPTRDAALRAAEGMTGVQDSHLGLLVWPPAPGAPGAEAADVIVGTPIALLREIRRGALQTADLRLICVDGADQAVRLDEWPAAQAILDALGGDAQKVIASGSFEGELANLLERQVTRPKRWPEKLFRGEPEGKQGEEQLWYGAAAREEERIDLLAATLGEATAADPAARSLVVCSSERDAGRLRAGLRMRGAVIVESFAEAAGSGGVLVTAAPSAVEGQLAATIRWGRPDDLQAFEMLPAAGRRIAIIDSLHVRQLTLLARRAGWILKALAGRVPAGDDAVERFRRRIRGRIEAGDLSAEQLLLQPLLEEHATIDVAAALAALLREERRSSEAGRESFRKSAAEPAAREAVLPAWTKIFLNVGKRDGAGPGDIVGAITGETGAAGGQIGLIELRPAFTLVDVDAEIADRVIEGLRGAQIKGRTVSARRAKEAV